MVPGTSKSYRFIVVIWLVLIQFSPKLASATDDLTIIPYIPNFVSVDYGRDNDHGRSLFVHANLGVSVKDRLLVGLGSQDETVSGSEEELENNTYLLGYSYIPYYGTQFGAEYEYWGDSSKVSTNSFRLILAYNAGRFAITLTPEFRKIKVNNDSQCDEDIDSGSVRMDLSVDINPEYTINVGYVSYDYSNNLTEMGQCVSGSEQLEIESRIDSVADDIQTVFGLDYYQDTETYGGSLSQSKTALLGLRTKTISFYASTDQYDDWTLTATVGITENTDDSSTMFLAGTVTYYW